MSEPFPLQKLHPELLLGVSSFWNDFPYGLPTDALSKSLYKVLSDPSVVADRELKKWVSAERALARELLRTEKSGQFDVADILISRGADVNARSFVEGDPDEFILPFKSTVFISICESRALKAVKYLLERGADLEAEDEDGLNALDRVVRMDATEVIPVLLAPGIHLDSAPVLYYLVQACERGSLHMTQAFLMSGVNPDAKSAKLNCARYYGKPLIAACKNYVDDHSIVQLLMEHGAN
ncbi:hypothetical protein HDU93_005377, partial [Gonapodya sp. JEL0774]